LKQRARAKFDREEFSQGEHKLTLGRSIGVLLESWCAIPQEEVPLIWEHLRGARAIGPPRHK
jgi:hypothetical protein